MAGVAAAVGFWLVLAILQVADLGLYSDDWAISWTVWDGGYWDAVEGQFDVLGSKPLLAFMLPAPYAVFGLDDPTGHQVLAVLLVAATTAIFYRVLRALTFRPADAVPIALLALLFPWASGVRIWPTGAVNNVAVMLLFAGLLVALRGLRVPGPRGLVIHLAASTLLAASVLVYESTTGVALFLWLIYLWRAGWRPAAPRAAMDVCAVAAAAIWSSDHTYKYIAPFEDQIAHIPDILRDGLDLVAASLVPVSYPAAYPAALTMLVIGAAIAVVWVAASRSPEARRWASVAGGCVLALGLCWAIYAPQAFYTPTFEGIEDRVNVVAIYPAAILVWAALRAAATLAPRNGGALAAGAAALVLVGYGAFDLLQQRDWARSWEVQQDVLAAIESADPGADDLVLVFDFPGETGPNVPTFNQSYDLWPAAQIRTDSDIATYPVFEGAELSCTSKGVAVERLPTPLYWFINLNDRETPKLTPYGGAVFVDVEGGRSEAIASRGNCDRALAAFPPGPWRE